MSKETMVVISTSKDGGGRGQEKCRISGVFGERLTGLGD